MSHALARVILILSITATLLAAAAGVLAVTELSSLRAERSNARQDNCQLLKGLVYSATVYDHAARASANRYIRSTPLRDCRVYARTGS